MCLILSTRDHPFRLYLYIKPADMSAVIFVIIGTVATTCYCVLWYQIVMHRRRQMEDRQVTIDFGIVVPSAVKHVKQQPKSAPPQTNRGLDAPLLGDLESSLLV
jgi:hypothetical protein